MDPTVDFLDAACHGIPTDMFCPRDEHPGDAPAAVRICNRCPIRRACLDWAVTNDEQGIWGGTTDRQRAAIRRRTRTNVRTLPQTGRRRHQVGLWTGRGYTAQQIADLLGISARTVVRHRNADTKAAA